MSTLTLLVAGAGVIYAAVFTPPGRFRERAITITVHDEQGLPVQDARIGTTHYHWMIETPVSILLYPWKKNRKDWEVWTIRHTNAKGVSRFSFYTDDSRSSFVITKEGYYLSRVTLPSRMPETKTKWTKKVQKITLILKEKKIKPL